MQVSLEHAERTRLSLIPENAQEEMLLVNITRVFLLGGIITTVDCNRAKESKIAFHAVQMSGDDEAIKLLKDYIS